MMELSGTPADVAQSAPLKVEGRSFPLSKTICIKESFQHDERSFQSLDPVFEVTPSTTLLDIGGGPVDLPYR